MSKILRHMSIVQNSEVGISCFEEENVQTLKKFLVENHSGKNVINTFKSSSAGKVR